MNQKTKEQIYSGLFLYILIALSAVFVALMGAGEPSASLQSPLSPVPPQDVSDAFSAMPIAPAPTREAPRVLTSVFWSSPLPWVVIGIVVFGGLAWVWIARFRSSGIEG
jgi:hypothetical protein